MVSVGGAAGGEREPRCTVDESVGDGVGVADAEVDDIWAQRGGSAMQAKDVRALEMHIAGTAAAHGVVGLRRQARLSDVPW